MLVRLLYASRAVGGIDDAFLRSLLEQARENNLEHGITGISEIDTRALTRHIRAEGAMRGAIAPAETDPDELLSQIIKRVKV